MEISDTDSNFEQFTKKKCQKTTAFEFPESIDSASTPNNSQKRLKVIKIKSKLFDESNKTKYGLIHPATTKNVLSNKMRFKLLLNNGSNN